jgi:long-chain acyl-CoA synthetase
LLKTYKPKGPLRTQYTIEAPEAESKPGHGVPRRSWRSPDKLAERIVPNVSTIYDLLVDAANKHGNNNCMGSRSLVKMHQDVKEVNGEQKKWLYPEVGPYQWVSFKQSLATAHAIGSGLRALGLKPGDKIGLFEETRLEWVETLFGCASQSIVVLTAYANLGKDALIFALNQGEITHLVANASSIKLLSEISSSVPALKTVIYIDEIAKADQEVFEQLKKKYQLLPFAELKSLGTAKAVAPVPPKSEDLAVLMYTSGSTGVPKGVEILHKNVIAVTAGVNGFVDFYPKSDVYISYLPLAHILALVVHLAMIGFGVPVGFGSPRTLTDSAVRNCNGDLSELKPTLMAAVPTILVRVKQAVEKKVASGSIVARGIFKFAYFMRKMAIKARVPTPILDKLVFNKIKAQLGGRLRLLLSGGAPTGPALQEWLQVCIGGDILLGYGLTESTGGTCVQELDDIIHTRVGPPFSCCEIKLVDVLSKGYSVNDKPCPRGEVWIRGPSVTAGYYKAPELTAQAFKEGGWFATGDIGRWNQDGTLSIIDREKNLIKPPHGEYISLEAIESVMKNCLLLENLMVHVDGDHNDCIAVVVPNMGEILKYAKSNGISTEDNTAVLSDKRVIKYVLDDMAKVGRKHALKSIETVRNVRFSTFEWTPETGLVTASLKINRKNILEKFKNEVEEMYNELANQQ